MRKIVLFVLIFGGHITLNKATFAGCGSTTDPKIQCTEVVLNYQSHKGEPPTAEISYTPCETPPGGPERTKSLREQTNNRVCVRSETEVRITPKHGPFPDIQQKVSGPEFRVTCKVGTPSCTSP